MPSRELGKFTMTRKKVVIAVVEGTSDERALSSITRFFREAHDIHIHFTNGDIFTKNTQKQTKAIVGDEIKGVMDKQKFLKEDILAVIQITDTDGVFIDDRFVVVDASIDEKTIYLQDGIRVSNEDQAVKIKKRNKDKSTKVRTMLSAQKVIDFPYYLLYFSCNLDHVLHEDCNTPENMKFLKAKEFNDKFKQKFDDFRSFFTNGTFIVNGTHKETWDFIQKDRNSLRRYSNFHLIFGILESLI